MKRTALLTFALMIVSAMVVGASASIYVKPDAIDTVFNSQTSIPWQWNRRNSDKGFAITDTAVLDGHAYEFGILGSNDRVSSVYFIGWFEDMQMLDMGMFSDGLFAYNSAVRTCEDFLPDDMEVESIFSSYDIYPSVQEGSAWFESDDFEHWRLEYTSPGKLAASHREGCRVVAERRSDGTFWFEVTF